MDPDPPEPPATPTAGGVARGTREAGSRSDDAVRGDCGTVLVVEDDESDEAFVRRALERACGERVRIVSAVSAEEAIRLVAEMEKDGLPRLILMDVKLPLMDGIGFLARIRENPATRKIAVIMFSSSESPKDLERAVALGADGFVRKPTSPGEYDRVIAAIASKWLLAGR